MHTLKHPKTALLTASQAIIRFLAAQYVEQEDGSFAPLMGGMFAIFGHGNVCGMGEALYKEGEHLRLYRGQNEQGMAHAAIAFAKANRCRRIMGVTTSIGPGATNLVTAAALAHINRLPVLFLPGDHFATRRSDPVLQQLEREECPFSSVNDCLAPVSRYFDRISRPEQLISSLPAAVSIMLEPAAAGPATLCLPQDVQTETFAYPLSLFEEKKHYLVRRPPDEGELQRASFLLKRSKRPLIIAGGGVLYSFAEKELCLFAQEHQIPVVETQAGKGAMPYNHPLYLGGIGVTGTSAANVIAKNCDLVLAIGTRLTDFTTGSKSLFSNVSVIGLNCNGFDADKLRGVPLVADAKIGLQKLRKAAIDYLTGDDYFHEIQKRKNEWETLHNLAITPGGDTTDAQVLAAVNQTIPENSIVVGAAGGLPGELHRHWHAKGAETYHLEYGYSCMGYEIAGALGAKLAFPDREVYALVGDGSYLMLHTELATTVQLGIKINVVLLDNHGFGCIHRLQTSLGCSPHGNLLSKPIDFVANAASYGCHAERVRLIEELKALLQKNLKRKKSCVSVIETTPQIGSSSTAFWDVAAAEVFDENHKRKL